MSTVDLSGVYEALKRKSGAGRVVMFISALVGEGVSPLVRQAIRSFPQPIYAVDLDVRRNGLARTMVAEGAQLSPAIDGIFGGASLFEAVSLQRRVLPTEQPIFSFHRMGGVKIFLGAFNPKALPQGAQVRVSDAPEFWTYGRRNSATIIVDAPALARSKVGLVAARHMDGVVLVVGDGDGAAPAAMAAKTALLEAGAPLLGLIYSRASAPVTPDRSLKRAG